MAKPVARPSRAAQTADCVAKAAQACRDYRLHRTWTLGEYLRWLGAPYDPKGLPPPPK